MKKHMIRSIFLMLLVSISSCYSMDYLTGITQYAQKIIQPATYIRDTHNKQLYKILNEATTDKKLSELSNLTIPDKNEKHPFEYHMVKRCSDRFYYLISFLMQSCLEQDPSKQNPDDLATVLSIHLPIISDLHCKLLVKALHEQVLKIGTTHLIPPLLNTGSLAADVLLFRYNNLQDTDKTIVRATIHDQTAPQLATDDKSGMIKDLFGTLPVEGQLTLVIELFTEYATTSQSLSTPNQSIDKILSDANRALLLTILKNKKELPPDSNDLTIEIPATINKT